MQGRPKVNVLIIDEFEVQFREELARMPALEVNYAPEAGREEVRSLLAEAEVLVLKSKTQVDMDLVAAAPRLRLVIRAGVGVEHIDVEGLAQRGIRTRATPGANASAVGEHALGMLLALMNNLRRADAEVRQYLWRREENRGHELAGRTVGIIGYGNTGQAFARKLAGFGCRVLAHDKYRPLSSDHFATGASLAEIQAEATVLTFHVPLQPDTLGYYDLGFLQAMQHPHWLLNLARGGVVRLEAVVAGLEAGKILGAGLDVLEAEPPSRLPPESRVVLERLFRREDVLFSPHIGGWSFESAEEINRQVLAILKAFAEEVQ